MNWRNYDEVMSTLISHDFIVGSIEIGKMTRVKRDGHDQKGWYVLHEITLEDNSSALIGSFGYWLGGESFKEKISAGKGVVLSKDQQEAIKARHAEATKRAEAQRKHDADVASKMASSAWAKYVPDGESTYLKRKNVNAYGLRFAPSGNGTVAIPMQDSMGKIWGLQIIRGKDRGNKLEKQYWPKGLDKKGHYYLIGGAPKGVLLIAEGYATAATLHEATGFTVATAFDAGNLMPTAMALHKKYPRVKILICADDDYLSEGNPGVKAAESAALSVGGSWIKPIFEQDREGKKLTDFNDLANFNNCSLSTVMVQVEQKLTELGWGSATAQAVAIPKGEGEAAFSRKNAVSIMNLDDAVERFVPLDDGSGKFVFDTWTRKIAEKKQMIEVLEAGIRGDDIKRHWQWQSRGAYYLDEIGFDPTNKDKRVKLNTWTGWEMTPKAGACSKILQTLEYLCSKEANGDEIVEWLVKWMAYPLQNPGAKMGSAIILHGPQGTGKSLIFRVLASIYGNYATVIGNRGLEDKFNADWADSKLFILAEEVATTTDKQNIKNELKELVTGETVRVNAKFSTAYSQKNQMNMAFLSNEDQPLILENDDRRHLVIYTPECLPESHYVAALDERDSGGIEAFYHFLMNLDLSGFSRHTRPPQTHAKQNLIALSLPSEKRFIKEWIDGETQWPCVPCKSMSLYACYLKWCKENGEPWPRPSNKFLGMIANMTGWQLSLKRIYADLHFTGGSSPAKIVIPPSNIKHFLNGAEQEKQLYAPNEGGLTDSQWLTGYVIDFENAKNDA